MKIDYRWLHFHRLQNISFFWFEIRMLRLPSIKFIAAVILDYIELWKSKCFTKLKSIFFFLLTCNSKISKVILPKHAKEPSFFPYVCKIFSNHCYSRARSHTHTNKGCQRLKIHIFYKSLNWDHDLIWTQHVAYF